MKSARIAALTVAGGLALAVPFLVSAQASPDGTSQAAPSKTIGQQHAHWRHGAGGHRGGEAMSGRHGHGDRFLRGLDLSEQQRDRIFEIRHAAEPKMREQAKTLRETRGEFAKLALSNDYDEAKVKALADRNAQAISEMAQLRARSMNEVYKVLTPEQQAKLQERQSRRAQRG
ncbi:MAG: Spy/CpxP family protein refolding chaperone [Burkholderiaceae bacterium]|jgi:Spy/CpxP family protein refolding chaperone|nr:Spy/CpxP family protein refolding chaperone [Burkholderiaceae bacterium]